MQFELLIRSGPCYDSYNRSVYPATSSLSLSLFFPLVKQNSDAFYTRTISRGGNFEKHENGMVSDTGSFEAYRRW